MFIKRKKRGHHNDTSFFTVNDPLHRGIINSFFLMFRRIKYHLVPFLSNRLSISSTMSLIFTSSAQEIR